MDAEQDSNSTGAKSSTLTTQEDRKMPPYGTVTAESSSLTEEEPTEKFRNSTSEIIDERPPVTAEDAYDSPQRPSSVNSNERHDNLLQKKWDEMFQRLVEYKEKHGNCLVPNRYSKDPQLGNWVSTQRRQFKALQEGRAEATSMTKARAAKLDSIGFKWSTQDPRHIPWSARYQELVAFREKYGHAQVPIGWEDNVQLSNWVSTQRQEYKLLQKGKSSRLTNDRIDLLNKVDFVWEAQRGGPRRKRKATVQVPPKANPVEGVGPKPNKRPAYGTTLPQAVNVQGFHQGFPMIASPNAPVSHGSSSVGMASSVPHGDISSNSGNGTTSNTNNYYNTVAEALLRELLRNSNQNALASNNVQNMLVSNNVSNVFRPAISSSAGINASTSNQNNALVEALVREILVSILRGALAPPQVPIVPPRQPALHPNLLSILADPVQYSQLLTALAVLSQQSPHSSNNGAVPPPPPPPRPIVQPRSPVDNTTQDARVFAALAALVAKFPQANTAATTATPRVVSEQSSHINSSDSDQKESNNGYEPSSDNYQSGVGHTDDGVSSDLSV